MPTDYIICRCCSLCNSRLIIPYNLLLSVSGFVFLLPICHESLVHCVKTSGVSICGERSISKVDQNEVLGLIVSKVSKCLFCPPHVFKLKKQTILINFLLNVCELTKFL